MFGIRGVAAAFVLAAATTLATAPGAATVAKITWGDQSARVGTVSSTGSGADFYNYADGVANVPFKLQLGTVYAFMHEQVGTGALSLGLITTGRSIGTPGCADVTTGTECYTYLSGWLNHTPDTVTSGFTEDDANTYGDADDPDESWAAGPKGRYYITTDTHDTSGFILDGFAVGNGAMFGFRKLDNFDSLVFVSGSKGAFAMTEFAIPGGLPTKLWIELGEEEPMQSLSLARSTASPAPVPLPAGLVLLLSALSLAAVGLRKRQVA